MYSWAPASEPGDRPVHGVGEQGVGLLVGLDACSRTSRSNVDAASSMSAHISPCLSSPMPATWCGVVGGRVEFEAERVGEAAAPDRP